MAQTRRVQRVASARADVPLIALAGYTNAGKSTLLNALTDADVSVRDRLFETLDPTTRAYRYHDRDYVVTDTVGFIRKLPHQLVDAFASTLEETRLADLVLVVADASVGVEEILARQAAVAEVLDMIGSDQVPRLTALNKVDLLDAAASARLRATQPDAVLISARSGQGLPELRERLATIFARTLEAHPSPHSLHGRRDRRSSPRRRRGHSAAEHGRGRRGHGPRAPRRGGALCPLCRVPTAPRRACPRARSPMTDALVVRVKLLRTGARLPARAYEHDAAFDLSACEDAHLPPGARAVIGTGLALELPAGAAALTLPRSGLAAEHGIALVNAPGLIDSGYRGELRIILLNTDHERAFEVRTGDRIAQLLVVSLRDTSVIQVRSSPRVTAAHVASVQAVAALRVASTGRRLMCPSAGKCPTIRVGVLLVARDRLLLVQQARGADTYWLLPGGGLAWGRRLPIVPGASCVKSPP